MKSLGSAKSLLVQSARKFSDDSSGLLAAAISYWAIFSVLPFLLLLLGLFGIVLDGSSQREAVINEVLKTLPFSEDQGREEVTNAVDSISGARGGLLGVGGLVVAAWSGSNMFGAIRRSLNVVLRIDLERPAVHEKLRDVGMVAGLAPFFLSSITATAVLRLARRASEEVPVVGGVAEVMGLGWSVISFLLPLTISFVAFAALYSLAPTRRLPLAVVLPGALAAAILFEVSKLAFSVYLETAATYEVVYGSLGVIVAFFLWVYISSTILLYGAEVVWEYSSQPQAGYQRQTGRMV